MQWLNKAKSLVAERFTKKDNREQFLGYQQLQPVSLEKQLSDIAKVVNYEKSQPYAVWEEEAWAQVTSLIDSLASAKTPKDQIDFYRGALSQTLELLRIGRKARSKEPMLKKQVSPTSRI